MSEPAFRETAVMPPASHLLVLSCPDRLGIVAAVANALAEAGCNIVDSAQFGDRETGRFFMRVSFAAPEGATTEGLRERFAPVFDRFAMEAQVIASARRPRCAILVSKFGHCLNDLLYRHRIGALPVEMTAIISNHRDFYQLAASYDVPFHHLPVTAQTKDRQEARLLEVLETETVEMVVLARYMQIMSPELCRTLRGRAINIHHSFLPSFVGAKPYHRAHARGVKLIGATAHYVTETLDEGPIIEQDVARVHHGLSAEDFVAVGRDVECVVLARAVTWHAEHRVLLNGGRTVVFR